MSSGKEIRGKIKSIQNTQKITRAMQMVAASKMRKAQDRMIAVRPYADKVHEVVWRISQAKCEYHHPFLSEREEIKRVAYILVTSDRGLCGGLNINLFRPLLAELKKWDEQGVEADIAVMGKKGISLFKSYGGKVISSVDQLGDSPDISDILGLVNTMIKQYSTGKVDRLYVVSNRFVNTMTQKATIQQVLPVKIEKPVDDLPTNWDYVYEPEPTGVVDMIFDRYIESQIYRALVENIACEQSARMVAMKAASDNATNLVDELKLVYNKARQASITQEISEIVSGAQAV